MKDLSAKTNTIVLKKRDISERNVYGPVDCYGYIGVYFFVYSATDIITNMIFTVYESDTGSQWSTVSKNKIITRPVGNEGHSRVISYIGGKKYVQIELPIECNVSAMLSPDIMPKDGDSSKVGADDTTGDLPSGDGGDGYDHAKLERAIAELEILVNSASALASAAGSVATNADNTAKEAEKQAGAAVDMATEAKTTADSLQGKIDLAQETATNAKTIASEAAKDSVAAKQDAGVALETAQETANLLGEIRNSANMAEVSASLARQDAKTAKEQAEAAVTSAYELSDKLDEHIAGADEKFTELDNKFSEYDSSISAINESVTAIQTTANNANVAATTAVTLANQNASTIQQIQDSLDSIQTDAADAKSIAENAQTEASSASEAASEAKVLAEELSDKVDTTKDTADQALAAAAVASANATNAETLAAEAKSIAEAGSSDIEDIKTGVAANKTLAESAQADATDAKTKAQAAADKADEAAGKIIDYANQIEAIDTKVDAANDLSGEAKEEALSAKAAANSAQESAKQAITDAAGAQDAADEAKTKATEAETTAIAASQTAADAAETSSQAYSAAREAYCVSKAISGKAQDALDSAATAVEKAEEAATIANAAQEATDGFDDRITAAETQAATAITNSATALETATNAQDAVNAMDNAVSIAQEMAGNAQTLAMSSVQLTGEQSIEGVKTFTDSPLVPRPAARAANPMAAVPLIVVQEMIAALGGSGGGVIDPDAILAKWVKRYAGKVSDVTDLASLVSDMPNYGLVYFELPEDLEDATDWEEVKAWMNANFVKIISEESGDYAIAPTPDTDAPDDAVQTKESVARDYLAKTGGELTGNLVFNVPWSVEVVKYKINSFDRNEAVSNVNYALQYFVDKNNQALGSAGIDARNSGLYYRAGLINKQPNSDYNINSAVLNIVYPYAGEPFLNTNCVTRDISNSDVVVSNYLKNNFVRQSNRDYSNYHTDIYIDAVNGHDTNNLRCGRGLSPEMPFKSFEAALKYGISCYAGAHGIMFYLLSDVTVSSSILNIRSPQLEFLQIIKSPTVSDIKKLILNKSQLKLENATLILTNIEVTGTGTSLIYLDGSIGSSVFKIGEGVTLSGSPTRAAICAYNSSQVYVSSQVNGSLTGKKYDLQRNSYLWTGGIGETALPGTIAGTLDSTSRMD